MRFSAVNVFLTTLFIFGNLAAAKPAGPAKAPAKAPATGPAKGPAAAPAKAAAAGPAKAPAKGATGKAGAGGKTKPDELAFHGPDCHVAEDCDYMIGKGNCYPDIGVTVCDGGLCYCK